jgi:oligoendopeptidase F
MAHKRKLKRSEVPVNLTWNLTDIFKTPADYEKACQQTTDTINHFSSFKDHLGDSAQNLLLATEKLVNVIDVNIDKTWAYAELLYASDMTNPVAQQVKGASDELMATFYAGTAFYKIEISGIESDKLQSYMTQEPKLLHYQFYFDKIRLNSAHQLTATEEKLLGVLNATLQSPNDVFDTLNDIDLNFGTLRDENGDEIELTMGNASQFIQSQNRDIRKKAVDMIAHAHISVSHTMAKLYNTHVHSQNTIAALRGYHSARSQQLAQNNIPEALYDVLISKTHEHINTVYRYYDLRKKMLGVEQLHHYDLSVPLTGKDLLPTTYEEGKKLALEALKPLGEDYVNQVKEALNNRWIDVAENIGKSSGGFEIGIATVHPYILLNWTNKLYSTNILVHELGHAIHSVRSNQTQPVQYSEAATFNAEITSTLNEILLQNYLIKKYQNDREAQIYLRTKSIASFLGTFVTQVKFAEFEQMTYQTEQNGQALSLTVLNQMATQLEKQFNGDRIVDDYLDDSYAFHFASVPHFYYNFYVYQYATAYAVASAIANKILSGDKQALDNYRRFLASGGVDYPVNLIKSAGVDMVSGEYLDSVFANFEEDVNTLEQLFSTK